MRHWLFKSEPETYGIDHLQRDMQTEWSGVRNYQARNYMREMQLGDEAFFYHSSTKPAGIVGLCRINRTAYPDFTAFDVDSPYYDARSTPEKPLWDMVNVAFLKRFDHMLTLEMLRTHAALQAMPLLQKGQRLSVQPVSLTEWTYIISLTE